MQPEVDDITADVKNMRISRKAKRKPISEAEAKASNLRLIREYNINRAYILQKQPWNFQEFPPEYVPYRPTRWFPPIFCLGVALSTQETAEFAQHLDIPLEKTLMHRYGISRRLTELCSANQRVQVKRCDLGEGSGDTWIFSLATNYDVAIGVKLGDSFQKFCDIVEEAFGSSHQVMWWLEYTTNHTPGHWWWPARKPEWIDGWDERWMYLSESEERRLRLARLTGNTSQPERRKEDL